MRAAIYLQSSNEGQNNASEGRLGQMQEFIQSQGWQPGGLYAEAAHAQHSPARSTPGHAAFSRMLAGAEARSFDVLCFWSLTELSDLGALHTLLTLSQLTAWGIGFHCFTEPALSTVGAQGDALSAVLAALRRQEIDKHTI